MGGAVAACQIEGAYDVDGRGLSSSDIHAYDKNLNRANVKERGVYFSRDYRRIEDKESYYPNVMELIFIIHTKVI